MHQPAPPPAFFPVHSVRCWSIIKLSDSVSDVPVNLGRCRVAAHTQHSCHYVYNLLAPNGIALVE